MKSISLSLFLLLLCGYANSSIVSSTGDGNWNDNDTWDGTSPGCYDTIVIELGHRVRITSTETLTGCTGIYLWIKGELNFQTGKKLHLPCGSVVFVDEGPPAGQITKSGGGGSSNTMTICGDVYWRTGDGDVAGAAIFCPGCSLPVELVKFIAYQIGGDVELAWTTLSEKNNDYFLIEHSLDGVNWSTINREQGAGNSSIQLDYLIRHDQAINGVNYYRLSQVDFDGAKEYFDVISVDFNKSFIHVYPNPVRMGESITVSGNTVIESVKIIDFTGKLILTSENQNVESKTQTVYLNINAGMYIVIANENQFRFCVTN